MHPAFDTLQFGPFKSDYHSATVGAEFREALNDYLAAQLLPQVDEPFDSTAGRLVATYDDQKHCGPNSAVRHIYTLEFEFRRPSGTDTIKVDLAYSATKRSFSPRFQNRPLHLWTASSKEAQTRRTNSIELVCNRILRGEATTAQCPCCGAELGIVNQPALFDISCPARCFNYNFHRDRDTGAFEHGHFFCKP